MKLNSLLLPGFNETYAPLPPSVKSKAREAYQHFIKDPRNPALHFKPLECNPAWWSVRVKRDHRAVGELRGNSIYWFWIGTKADFQRKF